ncbi:MAG: fimbrillin family protein [Bacteroidales bacterium]|nr:fimbrillin family protein [Bacteroidales bacterium]
MRRIWIDKIRMFLAISALSLTASCQVDFPEFDNMQGLGTQEVGIYAGGARTRTEMLSNGLSAAWEAGDELAVWARTSAGSFALSDQIFKTYGVDSERGYFTSTLSSAMEEGSYTYMCCYPAPVSASGTNVTFNLPAVQDGKASGGADIMIATPVVHGPLAPVPDPEDHSGMSLRMNRMMHQFRFWLPDEYDAFDGEELEEIIFTMPQNIAGTVTADVSDPSSAPTLSNGTASMTLELTEPVGGSSNMDNASFACAAVFPYDGTYTASDFMNLTVYSQRYKATVSPISLDGRTFLAGHSTPVKIKPVSVEEYYRLTMKVRDNHIGEPLQNVQIAFNGAEWYRYTNSSAEGDGNFIHSVEAYGSDGKDAYDLIINSIESGVATYTYETEHALVQRPLTADMMTYDGNRIILELGDVPYLIHEDFTDALTTAHDDDYTAGANTDRNLKGYLLDGYMPDAGWNAARFSIFEGDCIRINSRYESGSWVIGRYCGRLDTPALKYLKTGASVNVAVEFEHAFYVPSGFNRDDSGSKQAHYIIGTHTNPESSALNGENYNDIDKKSTVIAESDRYASGNVNRMNHALVNVPSATSSTRIVFWAGTDRTTSVIAANSIYYLYLDNIKVYINN